MTRRTIACIGECMIEMCKKSDVQYEMAFAGDTANTAIYLSRLLNSSHSSVDYVTALGNDPYSTQIYNFLNSENVCTTQIRRLDGEMPGIYFIETDNEGERSFYYYRSAAAAKKMFEGDRGEILLSNLSNYEWLYLSGISLSILDTNSLSKLIMALKKARDKGTKIVFDGNFRPAGWDSVKVAHRVFSQLLSVSYVALMTFADEKAVFGDTSPKTTVDRLRSHDVEEGAIKLGDKGCLVFDHLGEEFLPISSKITMPVDTTAAGDSFNAGFLFSRMTGASIVEAGQYGNKLAGKVIQFQGAIVPKKDFLNF
ncbi:sugar kinase [Oceanospirillaceae bacterium]|jgi:2-dehydro-3-deoxygluconokinase|nr:sugar kinase [Oceanospirillaceae bacterium]